MLETVNTVLFGVDMSRATEYMAAQADKPAILVLVSEAMEPENESTYWYVVPLLVNVYVTEQRETKKHVKIRIIMKH